MEQQPTEEQDGSIIANSKLNETGVTASETRDQKTVVCTHMAREIQLKTKGLHSIIIILLVTLPVQVKFFK